MAGDVMLVVMEKAKKSSPFPARHPQTQRALVRGGQAAPTPRSGRIERRAARAEGGERAPRNVQEAAAGARERQVMRS